MDKYYYFVSQLPTLFFLKGTDLTIENFLAEAQKWLSEKDYNILSKVDINDFSIETKCHHILKIYKNFESQCETILHNGERHNDAIWITNQLVFLFR